MAKVKVVINNKLQAIRKWIKRNPLEFKVLLIILVVGAFFRLYRISEYMTFLGDEGRDVIVVRRLLVNFDLILIGPGTSIGNMYLGPLYYYMMAPALLLFNFSPVGPAAMVALLGIATIFFVWYVAREWFPASLKLRGTAFSTVNIGALVAAGLYAISPVVITYSHSSWNPNIMPFFALLCIYGIWRAWSPSAKASEGYVKDPKRFRWLIVVGISFAFVLQSHYLGLLLGPVLVLFWLLSFIGIRSNTIGNKQSLKLRQWKLEIGKFQRNTLIALLLFAGLMSPLVIFDARHGWRNFEAIKIFFTQRQTTVSARPWTAIPSAWPNFVQIITSLVGGRNETVGLYVSSAIAVLALWVLFTKWKKTGPKVKSAYFLIVVWIITALIGFGVYKQHIYDHYFGFIFAALFILIGGLIQNVLVDAKKGGRVLIAAGLAFLIYVNLQNNPLKYPPNRQLQRTEEVAQKIIKESWGQKLNLAVIAERNYEGAYQYFLERWNANFIMIDPQRVDETVAEQLFVVCELPEEKCDPTHNPKAEVANFGWSKIENKWRVAGVTLYKLVHTN